MPFAPQRASAWSELSRSVRPIYLIGRFNGFLSFSFRYSKRDEIVDVFFSKYDLGIAVSAALLYCSLAYLGTQIQPPTPESSFEFSLSLVVLSASSVFSAVNVLLGIANRRNYLDVIRLIEKFDREIRTFGAVVNYSKHRRIIYSCYAVSALASLLLWGLSLAVYPGFDFQHRFWASLAILGCYLGPNLSCVTITYLYLFMLLGIFFRYRLLNNVLRWFSPQF